EPVQRHLAITALVPLPRVRGRRVVEVNVEHVMHLLLASRWDRADGGHEPRFPELSDEPSRRQARLLGEFTYDSYSRILAILDAASGHLRTRSRFAHVVEDKHLTRRVRHKRRCALIAALGHVDHS